MSAYENGEAMPPADASALNTGYSSNITKDRLQGARVAFLSRDVENSRLAHHQRMEHTPYVTLGSEHQEKHSSTSGEYFKAFIFGGLDGIVTIFAIVSGSMGAKLSPILIVIVGLGNLFADAVSMGFGEYVSASAENAFVKAEKEREEWEVENCPAEEKQEMLEIYIEKYNFTNEDAQKLIDITFKYREFFIHHMMVEELGLLPEEESNVTPLKRALVMFLSFSIFGMIPLGGLILAELILGASNQLAAFIIAIVFSLITLFILGVFKGIFVNQNKYKSALLMVLNGTIAGSVAFVVGSLLEKLVGPG